MILLAFSSCPHGALSRPCEAVCKERIMSEFTIHIHPELAEKLLADGIGGAHAIAAVSRQAILVVQARGRRIAYAPVVLPDGSSCAMSARSGAGGLVVEIDRLGTAIPGRGVVSESEQERERERAAIVRAGRSKKNRR
jgi:hypothetical protein